MPCSGCNSGIAAHVGSFIKYWCEADQTYHFDWEPCSQNQAPQSPPPYAPPVYNPSEPANGDPVAPLSSPAMLPSVGRKCGCCPSGSAGVAVGGGSSPIASPSLAVSIAKQCGCGYTNRDALLAIAAAFVIFLLIRE